MWWYKKSKKSNIYRDNPGSQTFHSMDEIRKKNLNFTFTRDNIKIQYIRWGQLSLYNLTFKVELSPDFFLISEFILDLFKNIYHPKWQIKGSLTGCNLGRIKEINDCRFSAVLITIFVLYIKLIEFLAKEDEKTFHYSSGHATYKPPLSLFTSNHTKESCIKILINFFHVI